LGGEADDDVSGDDQAVPLPPARVPRALAGERNANERLREEHETRDDGHREQVGTAAEDAPVARGADRVNDSPDDRHRREQAATGGFAVRPVERRQRRNRPDEPADHGDQHRAAKRRPVAHQPGRDPRPDVDEGRAGREDSGRQEPHRNGDLEAGVLLPEEDAGRPERMEPHEAAGGHEREREEQDTGVAAPIGSLARRIAEQERESADESEDDEMGAVVLEMGIELRAKQEGDKPDQR
jgi:hypothetical protein